jgi:hypothetical protein
MNVFAKVRYVNTLTRTGSSDKAAGRRYGSVEGHLKYIGFRSTELSKNGAGFFDRDSRNADWKAYFNRVKTHPALQHSKTIKVHQMILSLWGKDYQNYSTLTGKDFRDITRKVMTELEVRKGVKLDWIAAFHEESKHPHVHISLKAVGDALPGQPAPRIKLEPEDVMFIKDAMYREVEPYMVDNLREPPRASILHDLARALDSFGRELDQLQKETEHQDAYLKRKKRRRIRKPEDRSR